jgi:hypothetical protein
MHRIHRLKLGGGWLCHLLCLTLDIGYGGIVYAGADAASQRRLIVAIRTCLRYIHFLRRLDHVSHLETSVMGALLADYSIGFSFCRFFVVLHVWHIRYFVLLRPGVRVIW